ncbi:MAG: hypothetical protein ACJATW_000596 [Glaciecola sp.]
MSVLYNNQAKINSNNASEPAENGFHHNLAFDIAMAAQMLIHHKAQHPA